MNFHASNNTYLSLLNNICIYFSEEVVLSTGVMSESTHWKQTALWLSKENCFDVLEGDMIQGTVKYSRTEINARDYLITVSWTMTPIIPSAERLNEIRTQKFFLGS